ncbi:T9SS type A sorting domain-containing protein [bacterium]|nr:T9SS type A sorting domain-containing protein [bacterium]
MAFRSNKCDFLDSLVSSMILLFHPLLSSAQQNSEHRRWVFFMEQTQVQSPAVGSDGTIYIGTGRYDQSLQSDGVYAVNPDGTQKWKVTFGKTIHSSIALDKYENLYFIVGDCNDPDSMNAALVSLDSLGQLRWTFEHIGWMAPIPNTGFTPAIAADGTIYVNGRFSLFALDPNGKTKWKYDFPLIDNTTSSGVDQPAGNQRSAPVIGKDGTIYVNTEEGWSEQTKAEGGLCAFDPDGNLKWRSHDEGGCAAPVIDKDGILYSAIGSYGTEAGQEPKLLAINPDGTLKWSLLTELWIQSSPSIGADGTLYVGTTHHPLDIPAWVYAITPEGQIKWKYDTYDDVKDMPPAQQNPPDIYNSPAIDSNGRIYFGNEIGLFYCMSPDRKVEWIEDVWSLHDQGPALASDGTLYMATHSPYGLIALNTGSRGLADSPWPKFRRNNANTGNAQLFEQPESVEHAAEPSTCELYTNYPNPFNPATTIAYSLAVPGFVNLGIFNIEGQCVRELVNGQRREGHQEVRWNGTDDRGAKVYSGIYICRMRVESGGKVFQKTLKLCLVK